MDNICAVYIGICLGVLPNIFCLKMHVHCPFSNRANRLLWSKRSHHRPTLIRSIYLIWVGLRKHFPNAHDLWLAFLLWIICPKIYLSSINTAISVMLQRWGSLIGKKSQITFYERISGKSLNANNDAHAFEMQRFIHSVIHFDRDSKLLQVANGCQFILCFHIGLIL